jgi:hypothetical protein
LLALEVTGFLPDIYPHQEERNMTTRSNRWLGWLTVSLLALATPALADHHGDAAKAADAKTANTGNAAPSPEDRAKMAEAHEKMAACLRSNRPMKECRSEMKKAHKGMGHVHECSMGDQCDGHGEGHGAGHGKHHGDGQPGAATGGAKPAN